METLKLIGLAALLLVMAGMIGGYFYWVADYYRHCDGAVVQGFFGGPQCIGKRS